MNLFVQKIRGVLSLYIISRQLELAKIDFSLEKWELSVMMKQDERLLKFSLNNSIGDPLYVDLLAPEILTKTIGHLIARHFSHSLNVSPIVGYLLNKNCS